MPRFPDVVVVGAGTFGAWTAWHLRQAGHAVTLVDAFGAGHSRASSGGESRIIRIGYGERTLYSRWSLDSLPQWKERLAEAGRPDLFRETGVLWLGHDDDPHVEVTGRTLDRLGVVTESLAPLDLAKRFPALDFTGISRGIFEPHSGVLLARRAVSAVVERAVDSGVDFRVASVEPPAATHRVDAVQLGNGERLSAGVFVFACGPWLPRLFPSVVGSLLRVTRQEVFFFGTPAGERGLAPPALPAWIDFHAGAYGLPDIEGRGAKIGLTALGPAFDPDSGDRTPASEGLAAARRFAAGRLPALRDAPLVEARVCQYTNTPSGDLLIDRHPDHANVWLASGGSGHGFKLGPAVGAYVASQVVGAAPPEALVGLPAKRSGQERTVL
jgi:monomeric sarcosine oxidase